jgi:hypothetical protein
MALGRIACNRGSAGGQSFRDLLDSPVIQNMLGERCQRNDAVVLRS